MDQKARVWADRIVFRLEEYLNMRKYDCHSDGRRITDTDRKNSRAFLALSLEMVLTEIMCAKSVSQTGDELATTPLKSNEPPQMRG